MFQQHYSSVSTIAFLLLLSCFNNNPLKGQTAPTTNGLFYGDGDNERYALLYNDIGRGKMYYYVDGTRMHLAFVADPTLNDNVIGNGDIVGYMESVDWDGKRDFGALEGSDRMIEISMTCGTTSFIWDQDYLWGGDGGDPNLLSWLPNGINDVGDNGGDTPPPNYLVASSMAWNMNNTSWDVQMGDPSAGDGDWRSPSKDENGATAFPTALNHPYFSDFHQWEWSMVYEMSFDINTCGNNPVSVGVQAIHNSPRKSGSEDAVVDPPVCTINGIATVTQPDCGGGTNGSVNINISNGAAPYTYTWTSATNSGSGNGTTISQLSGGLYLIVITDANNCKYAKTIRMEESVVPTYSFETSDPSNCGDTDGSISLVVGQENTITIEKITTTTVSRINEEYNDAREKEDGQVEDNKNEVEFKLDGNNDWNGLRFSEITIPAGSTIEGAVIEFTAKDNQSGSMQVRVYGQANTTNPLPFAENDFDISIRTPTANFLNWTVPVWSKDNAYNTPDVSAIVKENIDAEVGVSNAALVFMIETRSGVGERKAYSFDDKPEHAPRLVISYSYQDTIGNDAPTMYNYQWMGSESSNNGIGTFGEAILVDNLSAGTYTFTIDGAGICTTQATANLNGGAGFNITNTNTRDVCSSLGQIELEVDGGNAPFTYSWQTATNSGTGTGLDILNLLMDTYNITLTDATGCSATTNNVVINYEENCDCSISGTISNMNYSDNNTPSNVTDDTFYFDLRVNGQGSAAGWEAGGKEGQYGATVTYGPYPVDAGGIRFIVRDKNIASCFFTVSANYSSCVYLETCTCCTAE